MLKPAAKYAITQYAALKKLPHLKKIFILFSLMFGLSINVQSQQVKLPVQFYKLKTNGDKIFFMRKLIGDSITAEKYENIPPLVHFTLGIVAQEPKDTLSHMLYQFLADAYDHLHKDSVAFYFYKALHTNVNKQNLLNKAYRQQSLLYFYSDLFKKDSILFYIHQLEETIKALPDTNSSKLNISNTLATSYQALSMYNEAIKNFRFVITQALKTKDSTVLLNAFVNIGTSYNQIGNDRMAVYYTLQAVPYLSDDEYAKMVTYANLTDYYNVLGKTDSAKMYLQKAEPIAAASDDKYAIKSMALRRASILIAEKKYDKVEPILKKSVAYFLTQEYSNDVVNSLLIYAALDTLQNNFKKAEGHLLQLYTITKSLNQGAYLSANLSFLATVNERLGDFKEAYKYQKLFTAIDDSIRSEKVQQNFATLQTEYETYKKEERITLLQKEGLIKDLQLRAALRNKTLWIGLSAILLAIFLIILYIRNLRNKATLKSIKGELEMKALRSQMNPHFIFNSLNSIQKYIWENKQENASEYLTKFARLIRLVLENSLHESVSLTEELDALRLYIEMEHRRNNQKFDYSITVADNIYGDKICLPPLLLQPYVENAIWHGLSNKEDRGKLLITISRSEKNILCIIEDDGIGRAHASEIRSNSFNKKSLAMNISSQRISWLQQSANIEASVKIEDKYNDGKATGTIVFLSLPLIEKHDQ